MQAITHCDHCGRPVGATFDVSVLDAAPAWESSEGSPGPLGVSWLEAERAYNFAVYSRHAERVWLLLYSEGNVTTPSYSREFDPLRNKTGPVWHCRVPLAAAGGAAYYAYRMAGPVQGAGSARRGFDADKVLLDPYAQSVYFPPTFARKAAQAAGSNEGRAPLGRVDACRCRFDWGQDRRERHGSDLVIYEMHVRGFTQHASSGISAAARGTFAGVIEKIPYLSDLGVTAVELMPVFQFDPQEGNYWGYMPLSFFAPHHAYSSGPSSCEQHHEFRRMVRALHEAGIEVLLDVVYNHTGEGNHAGPTYSFRGIDDSTYYMASRQPGEPYANYSGTGNTLNTASGVVRRLVVDSLRYWAGEMHVDGFRFDLASAFSRNADGSIDLAEPPIFAEIAGDPELSRARLIAEPWDAAGLFELGHRFPGQLWMQWNARYRDTLQRFVRGDGGLVADLMTRLYGSSDLFPDDVQHAFRPFQSVNYVTSHDGSTLYDLVSYNRKNNWANGHRNTDGAREFRWNSGWEGDEYVPEEVQRLRKRQVKNYCCLLMLSNGTPMFRMGDEFLHTQQGNNNPYNQDNEISWLDWRQLGGGDGRETFRFFKQMIAFRKAHPTLGRSRFWRDDVAWYGPGGPVDMTPTSRTLAFFLRGGAWDDVDLYVMINAGAEAVRFEIQEGGADEWRRAVDTARSAPEDIAETGTEAAVGSDSYTVAPRSVVVLVSG